MILLHAGDAVAPHDLLTAWSFEPGVAVSLLAVIAIHTKGSRRIASLSTRARPRIQLESLLFLAGCLVLAVALFSPLHQLGGTLFSAHMVQHELLMAVAAPLLVMGRPAVPLLWAFPETTRRRLGKTLTRGVFARIWRGVSNPFSAWMLHALAIWVWHAPAFYDASVRNEAVHAAQHLSFVFTALLFWWSVLSPRAQTRGAGVGIISLFTTGIHTTLLGALLATAGEPLFRSYTVAGTAPWGLTPLTDQQLGGVVMWIPAGIAYLGAALLLLGRWLSESGKRVERGEQARRVGVDSGVVRAAVLVVAVILTSSCSGRMSDAEAGELTGGNVDRGATAIRKYGCKSCHSIPGISGANALVGPSLAGVASRSYIAGVMVNSPDNMITWLRNPPAVDDKTAMPNLGVTEKDARDISAYLYTLR